MPRHEDQTPAPRCWDCERVIHDHRDHTDECSDPRSPGVMVREREDDCGIIEDY